MSDLEIRDGGIVAVDTDRLHAAAAGYVALGRDLADVAVSLDLGASRLALSAAVSGLQPLVHRCARDTASCAVDARSIATGLSSVAALYEMVELTVQQNMAVADGDGVRAGLIERRLAQLSARDPGLRDRALLAGENRRRDVAEGVGGPANAGVLPPWLQVLVMSAAVAVQGRVLRYGHGTVHPGDAPTGARPPVRLRRVGQTAQAAPPRGLADALARVPAAVARVRVETYTLPDASRRYAVYVAGTRDFAHWSGDGDDPADMQSNLELYAGRGSGAYETVRAALADAHVPDGADVYVFGHSQGGMIANLLAAQGTYRTRMLVTAGSPTAAVVGDDTVSVQLRHTDDLVQSLAGEGPAGRTGAAGSMVVERTADPTSRREDLSLAPHHLPRYIDTARMVDASADPRAAGVRDRLAELADATAVTAVEYDSTRAHPRLRDVADNPYMPGPAR